MTIVNTCLVAASISLIGLGLSVDTRAQNSELEQRFAVKKGGELIIDEANGPIKISTWKKNEVLVKIKRANRTKEALSDEDVVIEKHGNRVVIEGRSKFRSNAKMNYQITVPTEFDLKLDSNRGSIDIGEKIIGRLEIDTGSGSIRIGDVDGDLNADTSGGSIKVGAITGSAELDTSGGSISVEKGGTKVEADTSGGSIRIGPTEGAVVASTSGGSIKIDHAKGDVSADTAGGSISIAGSDANVSADTAGGSITIKNVAGGISAETRGGGIKIIGARGPVVAETSAGSIWAELVKVAKGQDSHMDLSTNHGPIQVFLPADLKASIEADLQAHRYVSDAKILSDFPLTIEQDGSTTIGRGDLNGGGDKIRLSTTNGHIRISKIE